MARFKSNAKARRIASEKEKISKVARILLMAFVVQFLFYLLVIHVVPFGVTNEEGKTVLNSFYAENWHNYKGSGVNVHTEGNGIKVIYWYNMILLAANLILCMYYIVNVFMEENERHGGARIKTFFKEHKGLMFLFIFMTFGFLSSLCAYDKFRSFIGCYNLRDGYFSFMFYGSMLVNMLFLGLAGFNSEDEENDPRKLIIKWFLITASVISAFMLIDYWVLNYATIDVVLESGEKVKQSIEAVVTFPKVEPYVTKSSVTSATFNNSNHFAYMLSISITAAACMFVKSQEKLGKKVWYLLAFIVMMVALIINDTFGAYLGIMVAIILMLVHAIISKKEFIPVLCVAVAFVCTSLLTQNTKGENIIQKDFSYIGESVAAIFNSVEESGEDESEEVALETDMQLIHVLSGDQVVAGYLSGEILEGNILSGEIISGEVVPGEIVSGEFVPAKTDDDNSKTDSGIEDAGDAGSGRWRLWVVGTQIAMENPILGVGLENMLYAYNEKGVNEGRSHNLVVQLAGTLGFPALICYIAGMAFIFFAGLKSLKSWDAYMYTGMFVMVSYLLSSLTGNSAFYTSGYFYIFVGLVVLELMKQKKESKELENKKK